jgi:hypothetical protein
VNKKDINKFFDNIKQLSLRKKDKDRMMRLLQVKDSSGSLKVMSYLDFKDLLINKKGRIIHLVLGPVWNRLVFVDIDVEF